MRWRTSAQWRKSVQSFRQRGFTLIELMVTISVAAILVALAAPGMIEFMARNRLSSQTNELIAEIAQARSESATRGARISLCISSDGTTCTGTDWAVGRLLFVDTNGNGAVDAGETILKVTAGLGGNTTLATSGFPNAGYIQFRSYGGLNPATAGNFKFCSATLTEGKQVAIAVTGRPKATTVSCS
jgi:type IV fimbrial biogenesis protein FimT